MQKLLLEYYYSENRATGKDFQIWFFPRFGGKNSGVLSMRMQVILDSLFARPGSAPIWGGKKGEFRDWTSLFQVLQASWVKLIVFSWQHMTAACLKCVKIFDENEQFQLKNLKSRPIAI